MSFAHLLFGFSGRINRLQYWKGIAAIFGLMAVLGSALYYGYATNPEVLNGRNLLASLGFMLLAVLALSIVLVWTSTAVVTKRLHDRNKNLLWSIPALLPAVLVFGALMTGGIEAMFKFQNSLAYQAVQWLVMGWYTIELGFLKGTPGGNRFGPVPAGSEVPGGFDDLLHGEEAASARAEPPVVTDRHPQPAVAPPVPPRPVKLARTPKTFGRRPAAG